MRNTIYISAMLIALLLTTSLIAQPMGPRGGGNMPNMPEMEGMPRMHPKWMQSERGDFPLMRELRGIELLDKQRNDIMKIQVSHRTEMEKLTQETADVESKIKLMVISDKYKDSELTDLSKKVAKFHEQKIQLRVKHLRSIRDNLTADQQLIFDRNVLSGNNNEKGRALQRRGGRMGRH